MKKFTLGDTMMMLGMAIAIVVMISLVKLPSYESINEEYTTEMFMVQAELDDGFLYARPIELNSDGGFILENKYELGDIVKLTYCKDDIVNEELVVGNELIYVKNTYSNEINYLMEEGSRMSVYLED